MINSGWLPIDGAREGLAAANLDVFLAAARERRAELAGAPVRDPAADRDDRCGWDLPMADGTVVPLLMPGVELTRVRDDPTASAPTLGVCASA